MRLEYEDEGTSYVYDIVYTHVYAYVYVYVYVYVNVYAYLWEGGGDFSYMRIDFEVEGTSAE